MALYAVAYPGIFSGGFTPGIFSEVGVYARIFSGWGFTPGFFRGVQQIQLRIEGRENGVLGGGSPLVRGSTQFAND
jgi:hypothetical protein